MEMIIMELAELVKKMQDGEFTKDHIDAFMDNAVSFGNANEEIQEELEDMGDKSFLFKVDGLEEDIWLKIDDGKLSTGKGALENPTLLYTLPVDVIVGILDGSEDSTAAYMQGKLKVEGSLSDATAFVSLIELIREEMEDAV
jgi:putative sterol carrier protein